MTWTAAGLVLAGMTGLSLALLGLARHLGARPLAPLLAHVSDEGAAPAPPGAGTNGADPEPEPDPDRAGWAWVCLDCVSDEGPAGKADVGRPMTPERAAELAARHAEKYGHKRLVRVAEIDLRRAVRGPKGEYPGVTLPPFVPGPHQDQGNGHDEDPEQPPQQAQL